ncbi:YheT family hydrolase [Robiginitalea sp. IMCC44478]|uniref:YheT family hydrolase n=1 Tax=Robiginitalea sp. IMCC44478 TaxID=3459122 RepID=UPI00404156FB
MPLVQSPYRPPLLYRNGHFSTIYSALLRKVDFPEQKRERLTLPDGDFLDLDWSYSETGADRLLILLHGLEGNAQRPYILGSVAIFSHSGWDVCAVNLRGCSGEPNKRYRSYHSGATEDLEAVLQHVVSTCSYNKICLKGFSLGGNLLLKYLGEKPLHFKEVCGAVAISVPCDLHDSLIQLNKPKNFLYARRFRMNLIQKLRDKQKLFPGLITEQTIREVKTLKDFDDLYTSKAHGFKDALDYYHSCSSLQFLEGISIPALLLNARNDSFLGAKCYPVQIASKHEQIYLEMPEYGGHVGFYRQGTFYYNEERALSFLNNLT